MCVCVYVCVYVCMYVCVCVDGRFGNRLVVVQGLVDPGVSTRIVFEPLRCITRLDWHQCTAKLAVAMVPSCLALAMLSGSTQSVPDPAIFTEVLESGDMSPLRHFRVEKCHP